MASGSHRELIKWLKKLSSVCKPKWSQFWHHFHKEPHLALSPIEESTQRRANTQWALAETTNKENQNNVVIVEVESFSDDPIQGRLEVHHTKLKPSHYTVDGEDPNLRITNYPPSNVLH